MEKQKRRIFGVEKIAYAEICGKQLDVVKVWKVWSELMEGEAER